MHEPTIYQRPPIELRPLRYFLAVVESGSISRAAEALHLSQPPLTAQIHQLEALVGAPLLVRHKRGVTPTAAGEALAQEARALLAQTRHALERVQQIGRGELGVLRIGMIGSLMWSDFQARFSLFQQRYPRVRCTLLDLNAEQQIEALQAYHIDIGLWRTPLATGDRISSARVARETMCVALPEGHRLAARRQLRLRELADEPMVVIDPETSRFGRHLLEACRTAGFEPRVAHMANEPIARLALVASGQGIALMPESLGRVGWPGVVFRSLSGAAPHVDLYLAWRTDDPSVAVKNFRHTVGESPIDKAMSPK